jgi:hypothetical protein
VIVLPCRLWAWTYLDHGPSGEAIMKSFFQRFGALILGVLHGFDRLRFRGSKRLLGHPGGVFSFLSQVPVPVKDYKSYAKETTLTLCKAIETPAKAAGLYQYLNNSQESKEATALRLAAEHGTEHGLIAVLGCVEPCQVVQVRGNRQTRELKLRIEPAKCLHYYHYYLDADYGLRYTRLQSWFPFTMHVGLNGRDWLARQMTRAGLAYRQKDNCFTWVEDWEAAQRLLDEQLTTDWASLLDGWAAQSHPGLSHLLVPPGARSQKAATASALSANIAAVLGEEQQGFGVSRGGGRRWKCTWIRRSSPWRGAIARANRDAPRVGPHRRRRTSPPRPAECSHNARPNGSSAWPGIRPASPSWSARSTTRRGIRPISTSPGCWPRPANVPR